MSSSQARLLNLTARMHQIEYKAAKLEAQKLQMANESSKVYQEYLNALDATKIQYSSLTSDGTITYLDATLNALENSLVSSYTGETSNTVLFLQDQDGKILVTPAIAKEYNLTESGDLGTLDDYLDGKDYEKTNRALYYMYEEQAVYSTREVTDTSVVEGFSAVSNVEGTSSVTESVVTGYTYTPVTNSVSAITQEVLDDYVDGRTITISSASDLVALSDGYELLGAYDYILTSDIYLSSVSSWTSIENFSGTFDGNGYTISGLTSALFDVLDGATVQNLVLADANITTDSDDAGILANTAESGTTVENVSVSGSLTSTCTDGSQCHVGALIGLCYGSSSNYVTITNCKSSADVTSTSVTTSGNNSYDVGGLIGNAYYTSIENCYSEGIVSSAYANQAGGLVGYLANSTITDSYSDCNVYNTFGTAAGLTTVNYGSYVYSSNAGGSVTGRATRDFVNEASDFTGTYTEDTTVDSSCYDSSWEGSHSVTDFTDEDDYVSMSDVASKENVVTIPSLSSIASNIYYALEKAGYSIDQSTIESWLSTFYGDDSWDSNLILANLNYYISQYLTSDSNSALIDQLYSAINNNTTSGISSTYTSGYYDDSYLAVRDDSITTSCTATEEYGDVESTVNTVEIPSDSDIANNVYYYLRQNGYSESDITLSQVTSWVTSLDDVYLANLNYQISQGTADADGIYSAITDGDDYDAGSRYDDTWEITQADSDSFDSSAITYGAKTEEYDTGETEEVYVGSTYMFKDSADSTFYSSSSGWTDSATYNGYIYRLQSSEEYWDTSDSEIANAIAVYYMAQRGVTIVTEEQASSTTWLTNMINCGYAVLTTFDPSQAAALIEYVENGGDISSLTDAEYNELLGIENTSVSTETCLQEVSDETNLKKAEAQYEADMKKIDAKDTKYDTQIAALETERDAISEEIDTLKTVASDNVERTFKLFS